MQGNLLAPADGLGQRRFKFAVADHAVLILRVVRLRQLDILSVVQPHAVADICGVANAARRALFLINAQHFFPHAKLFKDRLIPRPLLPPEVDQHGVVRLRLGHGGAARVVRIAQRIGHIQLLAVVEGLFHGKINGNLAVFPGGQRNRRVV